MGLTSGTAELWRLVDDQALQRIWSDQYNLRLERQWWLVVMQTQRRLRPELIPGWATRASVLASADTTDDALERALEREYVTKHDIKARLDIFCEDAGHQYHHLGLTSADVVENTMVIRVARSLRHLGLGHIATGVPLRGVHGAVGTDQDQLDLLGSGAAVDALNDELADAFSFAHVSGSVAQVAHRSIDGMWMSQAMVEISQGCARGAPVALMAGYLAMATAYGGDTWNEGDVSSSSTRRVAIPGFLASAALCLRWSDDLASKARA